MSSSYAGGWLNRFVFFGSSPSRSHRLMRKPQRAWRSIYDPSRMTPGRFLIKEDE